MQIIQLVVAKKKQLLERVTRLIAQVKQQFADEPFRLQLLNLLETIVLAKLPQMSRQELEAMFGVDDLRKTRFAQELIEEGEQQAKFKTIPRLLGKGFSVEEIADILQLDI